MTDPQRCRVEQALLAASVHGHRMVEQPQDTHDRSGAVTRWSCSGCTRQVVRRPSAVFGSAVVDHCERSQSGTAEADNNPSGSDESGTP